MFFLHTSNRTEVLLAYLGAILKNKPQSSPFATEFFLIQSRGIERVISQYLAREFSVFCNYRFFLPMEFLLYIAEKSGAGITADGFDRETLTWRIDALLAQKITKSEPVYEPLYKFLESGDPPRRRFQLARRLANLFDQYQLMRTAMIQDWQQGMVHFDGKNSLEDEKWQMALWQRLLEQENGASHRAALFNTINASLQNGYFSQIVDIGRISIFGVYTLPPVFLHFLKTMSRDIDVHLYLLSPCQEYWADMKGEKKAIKQAIQERREVIDGDGGHPLLAGLGLQGRELQDFLLDTLLFEEKSSSWEGVEEFAVWEDPEESTPRSDAEPYPKLLHIVQSDMLKGKARSKKCINDDSIRVVAAHSQWRELEIVREHVLQFLTTNPEFGLHDIVIMAPSIEEYAPLIPAVFPDFQHSIADCNLHWRNPAVAIFSRFLDLFTGRFGRSEVLEILQQRIVAEKFSLSEEDVAELSLHAELVGIRWGLSEKYRQELGLDFKEMSFAAGIESLLMGTMIDSEEFVDGILPYRFLEGKKSALLGGLCEFIVILEAAQKAFRKGHTAREWSNQLCGYAQELFATSSSDDVANLAELFTILSTLAESEQFTGAYTIEFAAIVEWFHGRSQEISSSSGFLRGQLTFCSMLPMRSIPFQMICLLGLNDGAFPKNNQADTFDLMGIKHEPLDRSPRNDDRYQFLEAIISARNILYLSYIGLSEKNGEIQPPSIVIGELLDLLKRSYGINEEEIVAYHPLYPFSAKYFQAENIVEKNNRGKYFSYSQKDFNTATMQQKVRMEQVASPVSLVKKSPFLWWQRQIPLQDLSRASLAMPELFSFIKNPQQYFVRKILGISLAEGKSELVDRECFVINNLQKYLVDELIFSEIQAGIQVEDSFLLQKLQRQGGWMLGTVGTLQFLEQWKYIKRVFFQELEQFDLGKPRQTTPTKIDACTTTGGIKLHGVFTNLYDNGSLFLRFGKLRGKDLLSAWLHHQLVETASLRTKDGRPWSTILLAEDGKYCFSEKSVLTEEGGRDNVATFPNIVNILQYYQNGCKRPLYTLVEPAFAWAKAKKNPQIAALKKAVEEVEKGYDAELSLLVGEGDVEKVIDTKEFIYFAESIVTPIYQESRR